MTDKPVRNMAASVRQRLLILQRTEGGDYNALLTQYAIERFLYRLSKSGLAGDPACAPRPVTATRQGTATPKRRPMWRDQCRNQ